MPSTTVVKGRAQSSPVGQLLRGWRTSRGLSQLELALHAGFSARHLSFIETGRSQPSRQALLVLTESLDVPLRERNRMLEAAGYAHVYRQTPLASEEMAHIRGVLEFILERHKPYGAVVHDRYSNCIMGNGAAAHLVAAIVDPSLLAGDVNYLRIAFHPLGARRCIVNWDEVSRSLLARAERELGSIKDDEVAVRLLEELRGHAGGAGKPAQIARAGPADLLVPIHIETADWELRLFSTLMTLGTAQDVTLQELRIETFFPADDESERTWRTITGTG
jgi:transcriptional regulator with XRE-family HTH domain